MKRLALVLLALALCAITAGPVGLLQTTGKSYVGLGDLGISNPGVFYSMRAFTQALAAAGNTKAMNVRRASDNATLDIFYLSGGAINDAAATAFGGVDASGTGSITGTALTFTGGHVNDTVAGTNVLPGTIIVSGSSPNWTVNNSQTVGSTTLTLSWALFITTWYNQIVPGTLDATQGTTAKQPQFIPNYRNGKPTVYCQNSAGQDFSFDPGFHAQPWSFAIVSARTAFPTSQQFVLGVDSVFALGYSSTSGLATTQAPTAADAGIVIEGTLQSIQWVLNGASSSVVIDGTATTVNPGTAQIQGPSGLCSDNGDFVPLAGVLSEVAGAYVFTLTPTQYGLIRTNQKQYFGTP